MRKPITTLAALFLLVIAIAQGVRAYMGFDVVIDTFHVPVMASWVAAGVAGLLSLGLFSESGR